MSLKCEVEEIRHWASSFGRRSYHVVADRRDGDQGIAENPAYVSAEPAGCFNRRPSPTREAYVRPIQQEPERRLAPEIELRTRSIDGRRFVSLRHRAAVHKN